MKQPLISIITPVYNAERFLTQTIDSVLNQTFDNFEYLLINDCSTDRSVVILEQYQNQDKRIKVINNVENSGAAVSRNAGLAQARGRYIAFIDSDDYWMPEKLVTQLTFMQKFNHAFTYTDFSLISEEGAILKEQVHVPEVLDYEGLLKNTAIACSTVMIDTQVTGAFQMPLVRKGQDTATWLMLMRQHQLKAYAVQEVLSNYRQVKGSISSNRLGALKRTWHTYYHLEKLPFYKALYYFSHYVVNAIKRRL